jgi:hypothetical protein
VIAGQVAAAMDLQDKLPEGQGASGISQRRLRSTN